MKFLFLSDYISPAILQAICRTLLHSLWQGLLAATVAGIIIITTKRSKASIRYNLLSFVFIIFLIGAALTFLKQPGILHGGKTDFIVGSSPAFNDLSAKRVGENQWMPALQKEKYYEPFIFYADKYAGFITGLWFLFFFFHLLKMLAGLHYVHRIRHHYITAPADQWKERLNAMSKLLGIRKAVSLMESALVQVPLVVGTLKPVILIPIGMIANLSPVQVETILLHELAHVRRKDFAINLLQRFAEAFFFFNPFIAWISNRIREEREACCDDIVIAHTIDKRSYLEALVSFRTPDKLVYGHAMALGRNNNLLYRVKRMITQENKKLNAMEKLTLILVLTAATALSFMPAGKVVKKEKNTMIRPLPATPTTKNQVIAAAKRSNDLPGAAKNDTVPEKKKITFSNVSSSINDDGNTRNAEVTAKSSEGKTYQYRLVNNEIVEMIVDGVKIKKEDFYRYDGIVDQLEKSRNEVIEKSIQDHKRNTADVLVKHKLLTNEQLSLQKEINENLFKQDNLMQKLNLLKYQAGKGEGVDSSQKFLQLKQEIDGLQLLLQNKLQYGEDNNLQLSELDQQNANKLSEQLSREDKELQEIKEHTILKENKYRLSNELLVAQDLQFNSSNHQLSEIIAELAEAGVIKDKNVFSFTLNDNELIVDGKKQNAALYERLRKQYIKHKNDHFIYKTKPNSRSTDVYVE